MSNPVPKNQEIILFGETSFRSQRKRFGIKMGPDRRNHVYVIGKTGMGKTQLMKNMAIQDIQAGRGMAFVDPHGEAAEQLLDFIPSSRVNEVVYFNPADINWPIAFNVMERVEPEFRHLVASGLRGVFEKIWPDVWSARMEYILSNTILALLEYPGSTLLGINRMLADAEFREKVVSKINDPVIKAFWLKEFARYNQRYEVEATAAIQNKIGQFISAPLIRNIVGQVKSTIDMRQIIDEGKILIANLSMGKIGEDVSLLLGGLLVTKLQLAAMSRADVPEEKRKDFFLYVDEFQHFATRAFVNILSEARKFRLCLTLGHQYISQMEEEVRDAVFGNVGTIISFRVGAEDAEYLEKEFAPEFNVEDLVNLGKYNIYLKLMIDGLSGRAFSAATIPPFDVTEKGSREKILRVSRERYATDHQIVESKIEKWLGFLETMPGAKVGEALYDAICSKCGKATKVVFQPDPKKPVYCKTCLKRVERGREERRDRGQNRAEQKEIKEEKVKKISLGEATQKAPTAFAPARKENKTPREGLKEALLKALKEKNK